MNVILHKNSTSFKILLNIAGFYHLLWGAGAILFPYFFFRIAGLPAPNYIELWQVVGLYTAILGIGYMAASSNPIRHWRIIFMGFAGKLIIVAGFLFSFLNHTSGSILYHMLVVNHVIWLFPFGLILYNAYQQEYVLDNELIKMNHISTDELLNVFVTNKQHTIHQLSNEQPVLLVFLRHFGCIFCKEALLNIQQLRSQIENKGTRIVLVNMQHERNGLQELLKYNLGDVEYIGDSESMLYKAFKLKRGSFTQLFGLQVFLKGIYLWFKRGAFLSSDSGTDVYQMPGIFLLYKGAVIKQFIHQSVADNPPYLDLASYEPRLAS